MNEQLERMESEFLHDIIRHPNDLSLKLIYADFLDDNDMKRDFADKIRMQTESYQMTIKMDKLTLPEVICSVKNGFVWKVTLSYHSFILLAREIFNHHPITEIAITDRRPRICWRKEKAIYYYERRDFYPELFNYLVGERREAEYNTYWDAYFDLNQACLKHGRRWLDPHTKR